MAELKNPIRGFIESVGPLQEYGDKMQYIKQSFIVKVPGYVDEFGEKKGRDNHWEISMLGDAIDKFNIQDRHVGAKVEVEVYINSSYYESKKTGNTGYIVNINLKSIKFLDQAGQQKAQKADISSAPEDDDLPF